MNLNELSELLGEAVSKQDFVSAAEIKEKIGILEVSKQALQEEMKPKPVVMPSQVRSEEHTSELQSPVPISYAVFCLKKKTNTPPPPPSSP